MLLNDGQLYAERYRVVRKLGEGAMGAVYEAENVLIRRRVAIKVLHPHVAERHDARTRFEREAQAAGRIGSPHIVEVLDMGELDGARFLVMELLEGETLQQRLRTEGRLHPAEAARLVLQLLSGLASAHAADIVHRDLKPANVFLTSHWSGGADFVKILDFGVSKFAVGPDGAEPRARSDSSDEDAGASGNGPVLGTPFYMSPEQAKGTPQVDGRSDLYSVGVILYECVTGQVPFEAETLNELIFRIVLEAPPPAESLVPDLDPAFAAILRKAMTREVGERYQSAREMHDVLSAWLSSHRAHLGLDTSAAMLWAAAPPQARGRSTGERAIVLGLLATMALGAATLFAVRPHAVDMAMVPPRPVLAAAPVDEPLIVAEPTSPALPTAPADSAAPAPTQARVSVLPAPASTARPFPVGTPARGSKTPAMRRKAAEGAPIKRTVPDEL